MNPAVYTVFQNLQQPPFHTFLLISENLLDTPFALSLSARSWLFTKTGSSSNSCVSSHFSPVCLPVDSIACDAL